VRRGSRRALGPGRALAFVAFLAAACATPEPSASPADEPTGGFALGCLSVGEAECRFVADRVVAAMPAGRGAPFAVVVQLYGCENVANCPRTLGARDGKATVEWADGGKPVEASLAGPPDDPQIGALASAWSGLNNAQSPRVAGPGPHPFELGHCGLTWQVDFDGSFWVPVGQVDGDASAAINAERGSITLTGQTAHYVGESGFTADLIRFPGPKHVWLCA
jgi:hypothetical protein